MKNKAKLKKQSRRVLTLLCALAMLLPLLCAPAQALDSGDITAQVVNGQVAIFKWTAIHEPSQIPAGTHYIMALTEKDTVWHNASGYNHSSNGWMYYTDTSRSCVGNRSYSTSGHQNDVFYTVGSQNALVVCYTPMKGYDEYLERDTENKNWDYTVGGPKVTVWTTSERTENGKIITSLTPLNRSSDYWGNWYDVKSFYNTYYKPQIDKYDQAINETTDPNYKNALKDARNSYLSTVEHWSLNIEDLTQKVAAQKSNGTSPLARFDSSVSKYAICKNEGTQSGNLCFVQSRTGDDGSIRIDDNSMMWGETEAHWSTRAHFNLWLGEPTMYSTLTKSYAIRSGQTLSLNAEAGFDGVYIPRGIKLVVEPGGTLAINETVYNDGTIINNGGTVIVQKNGRLSSMGTDGMNEIVVKNGDFIIMPGGAVYTNPDYAMTMGNSRLINFGTFLMGGNLMLYSSFIENREGSLFGGDLLFGHNRGVRYYEQTGSSYMGYSDTGRWADIDMDTDTCVDSNISLLKGMSSWYVAMVFGSGYRTEYGKANEKKDYRPYFANITQEQFNGMRDKDRGYPVPPNTVWKGGISKIYIYDTEEHYEEYGCITQDENSFVYSLDGDTVFIEKNEADVKNMINALVTPAMLEGVENRSS